MCAPCGVGAGHKCAISERPHAATVAGLAHIRIPRGAFKTNPGPHPPLRGPDLISLGRSPGFGTLESPQGLLQQPGWRMLAEGAGTGFPGSSDAAAQAMKGRKWGPRGESLRSNQGWVPRGGAPWARRATMCRPGEEHSTQREQQRQRFYQGSRLSMCEGWESGYSCRWGGGGKVLSQLAVCPQPQPLRGTQELHRTTSAPWGSPAQPGVQWSSIACVYTRNEEGARFRVSGRSQPLMSHTLGPILRAVSLREPLPVFLSPQPLSYPEPSTYHNVLLPFGSE